MLREYKKNRIKNVTSTNIKHTFIFLQGLLLMLLISSFVPTLNAKDFDDRVIKHIKLPKWFKESPFIELDDDLKSAQEKGKKGLMLFFTTEGCSYCDRFINKALADPEISTMVQKNFDSIGMEIFNDADITSPTGESITAKKFAKDVGVQFSPSLIFYGENGKQLLKLVGYQSPERFKKILNFLDKDLYKNET